MAVDSGSSGRRKGAPGSTLPVGASRWRWTDPRAPQLRGWARGAGQGPMDEPGGLSGLPGWAPVPRGGVGGRACRLELRPQQSRGGRFLKEKRADVCAGVAASF